MRNFIKWLIREETDVERLNSREIMLFKMINEKYKELGTKQKIINYIEDLLKYLGLERGASQFYYLLWKSNFRKTGDYSSIPPEEFIGPTSLPARTITNTKAHQFVRGKVPFRGSNLQGKWGKDRNGVDYYVVISYGWYPIYLFKYNRWYKITNSYSSSTGKQISNANPIGYDDDIKKEIFYVNKGEMEKLMAGSTHEDIIKEKPKKLVASKENMLSKIPKFAQDWGYGDNYTPMKVKFKITDVREENNKGVVDVTIYDAGKRETVPNSWGGERATRKMVPSQGGYLRGEIPNVDKQKVENIVKNKIIYNFKDYIGTWPAYDGITFDMETNPDKFTLKFNFIHEKE